MAKDTLRFRIFKNIIANTDVSGIAAPSRPGKATQTPLKTLCIKFTGPKAEGFSEDEIQTT
ncbi:MAG: hypothetical protein OXC63_14180 [Aestuariivita sp.]|nr:hypothetical protein [Aestuariivita sp.]